MKKQLEKLSGDVTHADREVERLANASLNAATTEIAARLAGRLSGTRPRALCPARDVCYTRNRWG